MTTMRFLVTEADTAVALGSGDVAVLATPRLLAWIEAATVRAAAEHLAPGQTSVGVEVTMQHRRATPVGEPVRVRVTSAAVQDRRAVFDVTAYDRVALNESTQEAPGAPATVAEEPITERPGGPRVIATARVTRAIVDRATFEARLTQTGQPG